MLRGMCGCGGWAEGMGLCVYSAEEEEAEGCEP